MLYILLVDLPPQKLKEVIHIISFEAISGRLTLKSFHEPSVKSIRIDVIALGGGSAGAPKIS